MLPNRWDKAAVAKAAAEKFSNTTQAVQVPQHLHILKFHRRERGYICDVCRRSFSAGDHSYYCSNCDFDACISCSLAADKAAADKAAADKAVADKAAATKVAADKAAAAKAAADAQHEAEDAQLAAAIAASLAISCPVPPPSPFTPTPPPTSLATSRFMESYNKPERRPDQLYAPMTTERH